MATIVAAQSGNWSATATWVGGVVPTAGDIAQSAGFNVTIDQNITVDEIQTTASNGQFTASTAGYTINATVRATTGNGLRVTHSSGTTTVNGDVIAVAVVGAILTAGGELTINGTATGGNAVNAYGVQNNVGGTINVTTVTGGTGTNARGVFNISWGTVNITTATGGSGSGAHGAYNNDIGTINVDLAIGNNFGDGSVTNQSNGAVGNTANGLVYVKRTQSGPGGMAAIGGRVFLVDDATNSSQFRLAANGATKTLVDTSTAGGYPATTDVRLNTVYKNGDLTGTLAVPNPNQVAFGIATDNTTGTAVLTPSNVASGVWDAVRSSYTTNGTFGDVGDWAGSVDVGAIADAVWDEVLTGATHNVTNSAGKRLRQISAYIFHDGTAQAGSTSNTIKLSTAASAIDGEYDPSLVLITAGTGIGQARNILQYTGSTRVAVVDRDWKVTPDATSEYVILADAGREHVNEGLVTAATSTTAVLNASASSSDYAYNGQILFIRSGTGADQAKRVVDYVGATRTATICDTWATIPDTTSAYVMLPTGMIHDSDLQRIVWDVPASSHDVAGTTGARLNAAGSAADPLLNPVPGTYPSGSAGSALGRIANNVVNIISPISADGKITVVLGDDYKDADGRALTFTSANWPTLTGGTIQFRIQGKTGVVQINGSVVSPSTAKVELTSANIEAVGIGTWEYDLQATLTNNNIITLKRNQITVLKDVR